MGAPRPQFAVIASLTVALLLSGCSPEPTSELSVRAGVDSLEFATCAPFEASGVEAYVLPPDFVGQVPADSIYWSTPGSVDLARGEIFSPSSGPAKWIQSDAPLPDTWHLEGATLDVTVWNADEENSGPHIMHRFPVDSIPEDGQWLRSDGSFADSPC